MNALTFESASISPRRAAVRRIHHPDLRVVAVKEIPSTIAASHASDNFIETRRKLELIVAIGLAIVLHTTVIYNIRNAKPDAPIAKIQKPLAIEIAPPPKKELPPPPIVQPKPLPKVAKAVTPVKKVTPQPLPVVPEDTPMDTTPSENTVQVATAPIVEPPAPLPAAPVETVTEPRGYAGYLNNPAPVYPDAAQRRGLQGKVLLKVRVLASGKADAVSIAKSSGHSILDDAAVKAVTAWMFEPAKRGNTPIDGWVQIPLTFKL